MIFKRFGAMTLAIVFCIGLQCGAANADSLDTMVFSDGSEFTVQKVDDGEELTVAEPYQGTMLSEEELFDQGALIESYPDVEILLALEPVTSKLGIETIIGIDARVRTYTTSYPARAVVLITFDAGRCTGWLIGDDTVVTAGHCVHSGGTSGSWYPVSSYEIYPGRDESIAPYGSCDAMWLASVKGWTEQQDENYDYGVIKLDCDVGTTTGYFGFFWKKGKKSMKKYPAAISGYPGDKPLSQWQSHDIARVSNNKQIFYNNDTFGGMSGSPVWFDDGTLGPYAIGIHTTGPHGSGAHSIYNHGTRINKEVFNNLVYWKTAP